MTLRLVSSKLCPYAQRSAIVLHHKGIAHDLQFIDLRHPPDWLQQVSPLKKVPVLLVNDQAIFGSSVIAEYLEDSHSGRLHPPDPLLRAQNRSWIDFSGDCMNDMVDMALSPTHSGYQDARERLHSKFDHVEAVLGEGPYFNGAGLSYVDVAYAPLFQRLDCLDDLCTGVHDRQRHSRLLAWKDRLLAVEAVRQSTLPDLPQLFQQFMLQRGSYVSRFIDASAEVSP